MFKLFSKESYLYSPLDNGRTMASSRVLFSNTPPRTVLAVLLALLGVIASFVAGRLSVTDRFLLTIPCG